MVAVILEPKKIKCVTVSTFSPSICHEVMGQNAMILVFWMTLYWSFKICFQIVQTYVCMYVYIYIYIFPPYFSHSCSSERMNHNCVWLAVASYLALVLLNSVIKLVTLLWTLNHTYDSCSGSIFILVWALIGFLHCVFYPNELTMALYCGYILM